MSFSLFFHVVVVDLLRYAILLLIVSFFVGFRVGVSDDKVSIRLSYHIKFDLLVCFIFFLLLIWMLCVTS